VTKAAELRVYLLVRDLQPQFAAYLGTPTRARGYPPIEGDHALIVEVAPGLAIERIIDLALKSVPDIEPGIHFVERQFGVLEVHARDADLVQRAGQAILEGIGYGLLLGTGETQCISQTSEYDAGEFCTTGSSTLGLASLIITWLLSIAYLVWNYGYRQGTTGSSIGKSIMKFKVVSEKTGQPIGFGMSIVRQLAHIIDGAICYIGYLFPLWDAKRQTIADKIMTTICLPI